MSKVHKIRDRRTIDDEAAQWVWRLDAEDVSPEMQADYQAWLGADARHRAAIDEYSKVWRRLDDLAALKSDSKVRTVRHGVDEEERQRRFPVPLRWVRLGAAATLLCAAVLVTYHFGHPKPPSLAASESYATAIGQQRTVALADGSVVEMNTNSIIDIDFTASERVVRLSRGEVHFAVAKNPDRPFLVEAGDTWVRAVGTAFSVHVMPQAPVQVLVTEGEVEVIKAPAALPASADAQVPPGAVYLEAGAEARVPSEAVYLEAGADARVSPGAVYLKAGESLGSDTDAPQRVVAVSRAEIEKELAWRNGMLVFEGDPLELVVEELSRYTQARFVIVDDSIRQRRVGGHFKTDDVDGLLSVLERGLSVEVRRQGSSVILLADADKD